MVTPVLLRRRYHYAVSRCCPTHVHAAYDICHVEQHAVITNTLLWLRTAILRCRYKPFILRHSGADYMRATILPSDYRHKIRVTPWFSAPHDAAFLLYMPYAGHRYGRHALFTLLTPPRRRLMLLMTRRRLRHDIRYTSCHAVAGAAATLPLRVTPPLPQILRMPREKEAAPASLLSRCYALAHAAPCLRSCRLPRYADITLSLPFRLPSPRYACYSPHFLIYTFTLPPL